MTNKKRPNRGKLEIKIDILRALYENGESNRTRLLYKSNMSWAQLLEYLNELIVNGCIEVGDINGNRPIFRITLKGVETIKCYDKVLILTGAIM